MNYTIDINSQLKTLQTVIYLISKQLNFSISKTPAQVSLYIQLCFIKTVTQTVRSLRENKKEREALGTSLTSRPAEVIKYLI